MSIKLKPEAVTFLMRSDNGPMRPYNDAMRSDNGSPDNNSETDLGFPMAFSLLVMGAIAMGASPVFVREAGIGPFTSAFWRVAIALPILWIWFVAERKRRSRSVDVSLTQPAILSGLFFAGDLIFWHLSILNTTIANATLMACLAPVWVLLLSGIFIGEPVSRKSFMGLGLCLTGAGLLMGASYRLAPEQLIGDLYGIVTSLFFGLYFLAIRVGRRNTGSGELTLTSTFVTTVILLVVALWSGEAFLPDTASGYANILALGAISHVGGQGLLTLALGSLTAVFSSLVIFVEALAAAFLGWLLFSETLGLWQVLGGALILLGVWVARPISPTPLQPS